jgi:dihydrofolate synthase/folylpolyglutamate synthase
MRGISLGLWEIHFRTVTYEEALAYIASLEARGWRLGLDRMEEFARRLGLQGSLGEPGGPQFIHVAGTNGKGSVTAYVQSMFVESGYSAGSFFSPFVYDPRERIQVGRRLIPKRIFALLTEWIRPFAESLSDTKYEGVTEFEFKTGMALQFWKEMVCDWVALEVGLGGRLDATNIVTPRCSVIVSIGMDHTHILGDSLAKIAAEKGGIIKPGVPVVLGEMPETASDVLEGMAGDRGCAVWRFGKEILLERPSNSSECTVITPRGRHEGLTPGIQGVKQPHNMALAVAAMSLSGAMTTLGGLQRGAKDAFAPGRMQRVNALGRSWLLDGAHNREAATVLAQSLAGMSRQVVLLTGMVQGHEPEPLYKELAPLASQAIFVPIDFHRAVPPPELLEKAGRLFPSSQAFNSLDAGIQEAMKATTEEDTILVTGSFYLVGEVGRILGLAERP